MKTRAIFGLIALVATSSLASLFAMPRGEHYAATKAALNALVRALAVEHARYGITANGILPGWIETEMTAGLRNIGTVVTLNLSRRGSWSPVALRRWLQGRS